MGLAPQVTAAYLSNYDEIEISHEEFCTLRQKAWL